MQQTSPAAGSSTVETRTSPLLGVIHLSATAYCRRQAHLEDQVLAVGRARNPALGNCPGTAMI